MVEYNNGTVFNCDADAIVNTVNCLGVMGAGIALEFSLRYPEMYEDYVEKCKRGLIKTGIVDYFIAEDKKIINFPTKWHFKYPSKIEWIEQGLLNFVSTYKKYNIKSVAFPKLGTSNGGLEWKDVRNIMEKHLNKIDIPVYICLDVDVAQGVEKEMLEIFNTLDHNTLKESLKANKKQLQSIEENRPIDRFWKIKELDGIGLTFYTKLYTYCKTKADDNPNVKVKSNTGIQLSMLDML